MKDECAGIKFVSHSGLTVQISVVWRMLRGSDVGQLDAVEKRNARSMRALAG
jgi:hypothetical protein